MKKQIVLTMNHEPSYQSVSTLVARLIRGGWGWELLSNSLSLGKLTDYDFNVLSLAQSSQVVVTSTSGAKSHFFKSMARNLPAPLSYRLYRMLRCHMNAAYSLLTVGLPLSTSYLMYKRASERRILNPKGLTLWGWTVLLLWHLITFTSELYNSMM